MLALHGIYSSTGGRIVGKTTCENLCFSGGSSTAAKGPVLNPYDKGRSTAGSSSGSAVAVRLMLGHYADVVAYSAELSLIPRSSSYVHEAIRLVSRQRNISDNDSLKLWD